MTTRAKLQIEGDPGVDTYPTKRKILLRGLTTNNVTKMKDFEDILQKVLLLLFHVDCLFFSS